MSAAKPAGLRVVLDTNVYVSAFTHPQGALFGIWRQGLSRRYTLLVSPAIVAEVAGVLRRDFDWEEPRIISRLKMLTKTAEIVSPTETLNVISDDPDDDRILECAVAGQADLIVSGDRHLTRPKDLPGNWHRKARRLPPHTSTEIAAVDNLAT